MDIKSIDPDMPVDEIMRRWPATVRVMMRYQMLCVGCPIGSFHTLTEACEAHGVDEDELAAALLRAMRGDPLPDPQPHAGEMRREPGGLRQGGSRIGC